MSNVPPVPTANQSPFPLHEKPHTPAETAGTSAAIVSKARDSVKAVPGNVTSLATRAGEFVQERPWAAAALFGSIAVAFVGTLRGRRG